MDRAPTAIMGRPLLERSDFIRMIDDGFKQLPQRRHAPMDPTSAPAPSCKELLTAFALDAHPTGVPPVCLLLLHLDALFHDFDSGEDGPALPASEG
jgi:hypothetical protein